jgi:hypothetical protein
VIALPAAAVTGCDSAARGRAAPTTAVHASAAPTPSPTPAVAATEPGGGVTLFPSHRLVMYYGAAGTTLLGVLGDSPPAVEWRTLSSVAARYERPDVVTVPTFELIVWVEQGTPGPDGSYAVRVPDSTIAKYYAVAHAHHGMLVLDVQPGRHEFLPLAQTLTKWMDKPDVGLALDPEWKLYGNQVPDQQIGFTDAASVNAVSRWLSGLVAAQHLPQKLLLVHNFTGYMLHDEPHLAFHANLALTENGDGFGHRANKLYDYHLLAADPRLWLGFKVFYKQDIDLFTPAELLALPDPPDVIDYQ